MDENEELNTSKKQKTVNIFNAQVNCQCNRNCADRIDVLVQKDVFDKYYSLKSWSEQTKFLRSIAKREAVKENNSSVRVNLKKREYFTSYFLNVPDKDPERVCCTFLIGLLQINRSKLFRALSSITENPSAVDRRGHTSKRKANPADIAYIVDFLKTLPQYESKIKPNVSPIKYFHPNLTVQKVYQIYENICQFQQRNSLSKTFFVSVLKERFGHLKQFRNSKDCRQCKDFKEQKKRKILSLNQTEKNKKEEEEHNAKVKAIKVELMQSIDSSSEETTEVFSFELQRPLEMPCVPINESYDWRQLWFSNLCVFDEKRKLAYMYTWDEAIAERGPEQIASCLLKHIYTTVPKTAKTVILYSKSTSLYRNMKISLMLKKIYDYPNDLNLTTIEQRFFLKGHDSNDCNRCFEAIEKQKKNHQQKEEFLYAPNEWSELIASAKQTDPRSTVINMTEKDFFSVKQLMNFLLSEKHSANGDEIYWSKISNITYTLNEPLNLCVRYIDEEPVIYLLSHQDTDEFRRTKLVYSNMAGNAISKAKFENLQKNMKYIPNGCHEYYNNMKYIDGNMDRDFALASYSSDEE